MTEQPRVPAGSSAGGQFMSYDSSKNKGTGYDKKGGDSRVIELQRALNAAGFTDGKGKKLDVDGMLGPLTTAAIKKAQTALGMKPTGKVNADFIKQLKKRKGGKARVGAKQDVKTNARKPRVGAHQDTKRTSKSKPKKFHVAAVKTSKRFSATTRAEKSNRREAVEYDDEQLELMVELLATLTPNRLDEIGDLADAYLAELSASAQEATAAGAPPGSGANFKALAAKVGSPALAAYIGRKKYGKKKFQALAAAHRKRKKEAVDRNPSDHPRGQDGKFIKVGNLVDFSHPEHGDVTGAKVLKVNTGKFPGVGVRTPGGSKVFVPQKRVSKVRTGSAAPKQTGQ